ncbi:hypothetical protein C900_02296 [Fulvivirga imtechensis AK7]|uniref:Uncharacterized protein n=1 Tax=Fulvivirga imtechensis AK7 TaxID=1237149 RepID=L8JRX7_9BACT|nr:hypothetical protein C900_02296 [Fulvivirga imtechensis AK7]
MWALEKNLKDEVTYFEPLNGQFQGLKKFEFLKIVGESESFIKVFNQKIGLDEEANINETFKRLEDIYMHSVADVKVLFIVVDEFGKFLEFAAKNNPDKELYFIQQLAEYINDPKKHALFVITLHKNFKAYARGLSRDQKLEWDKVKGRLIDIAFDEPIEQLLYLSSRRISEFGFKIRSKKNFVSLFKLINDSGLISHAKNLDKDLAAKLYPMDYLSANILTQALQKYGQNERSLFTFLASREKDSLQLFDSASNKTYNVADVFDYLIKYMSSELEDRDNNPHKPLWQSTFTAIQRAEALNDGQYEEMASLLKCIGLINLFGKPLGRLDKSFLEEYAYSAMGIENANELIDKLIRQKIIKYYSHRNKIFFLEGTDVDFEQELIEASSKISPIEDVKRALNYFLEFPTLPAKRIQYLRGTPRFFAFNLYNWEDISDGKVMVPDGEVDGYINIVFGDKELVNEMKQCSVSSHPGQIFVLYSNISPIGEILFEIGKIDYVVQKLSEDPTAQKILLEERHHEVSKLRKLIFTSLYSNEEVQWFNSGKSLSISSYRDLNSLLSDVAEVAYYNTPVYLNEMVNREHLSSPILTARKALLNDIIESSELEDLDYPSHKFPPQKTIYQSLLKDTGIHRKEGNGWVLGMPVEKSFLPLWNVCESFLDEAKAHKKSVNDLYEALKEPPLKLKKGLIEFWIPIFLIIRREDYALFHVNQGYIPYLTSDVLDLIHKKPKDFLIKTYDVEGIKVDLYHKYRELAALPEDKQGKGSSFISIFSQFMRFYNDLPQYNKQTGRLTSSTSAFREAIEKAKDPEEALFEQFPKALGFHGVNLKGDESIIQTYLDELNTSIFELRTAFSNLLDRVESKMLNVLGIKEKRFLNYKSLIQKRFGQIDSNLLLQKHRTFFNRLMSPLDDRDSWLQSLCDVLISRNLKQLKDDEEPLLMVRIEEYFGDLEKLLDIHSLKKERIADEIIRFEVFNHDGSKRNETVIIPSDKKDLVDNVEAVLMKQLTDDRHVNKAALIRIINKYFDEKD